MLGAIFRRWLQSAAKSSRKGGKLKHDKAAPYRPLLESLEDRVVPTTPSVLSILRSAPVGPITNATSVNYAVTFNQSVTGVAANDFNVVTDGGALAGTPVAVSGSGAAYTVTVNGIHGSGDLQLDLIDNDSILGGGVPLGGPGVGNGSFQGQTYNVLQTFPSVLSITRASPANATTNATTVSFTVTFSTSVTGVNPTDFQLATTGTVGTTLTQVTPLNASVYTVTVSGITGNGSLGLNLVDNGSIHDLAGNPLTQQNAQADFNIGNAFTTGLFPESVAIGDVNGDGIPDLAFANKGSNTVSVLLGNGNGTFQAQQTFATGSYPISMALGDVNGDGKPDLVVVNNLGFNVSGTVSVLLGNGNGTFQAQQTYATGSGPFYVTLGDVTEDGKPDLVVADAASNAVSVLLGNGDGTFQAQHTFAAGSNVDSVALGDVNGDSKPDLVVANGFTSGTVSVLLGNGNGSFQAAQQTFATGSGPGSVSLGDVNGDSRPDLVVPNVFSNTVSVLIGNGNGTFQAQQTFATGSEPFSAVLVDLNVDGKLDLAVANSGGKLSVLLGNGNGSFQAQQTFVTGSTSEAVAVGDLNGDGKPDLAVANSGTDTASVLLGNGNGTFQVQSQQAFATGSYPTSVALGDVNGDGKTDFVVANNYGTGTVSVLLGGGNGSFQAQQTFATGSYPRSVALRDVNGDGKPDLVVANYGDFGQPGTASVLLANGNGTFQAQQTFATGSEPLSAVLVDVNGDGKPDLAVANKASNTVSVLLGNGNGSFQSQQTFATGPQPFAVAVVDVNGDGNLDLIVGNSGNNTVSVLLGNGNGSFQAQQTFATGADPLSVAVGDVNGDGKHDLIVANRDGGTVSVLLGNGNGSFQAQQAFGIVANSMGLGDLNGDGTIDLAVTNPSSNTVSVLLNVGNGNFTGPAYTIDTVAPFVQLINRATPAGQNTTATTVSFTVTFNEPVTGVNPTDFQLATIGTVGTTLIQVTAGPSAVYTVTVSGITGNGTLGLNLVDNGSIRDLVGDLLIPPNPVVFQAQQTLATGSRPSAVAVVDVNGDGIPDLAVANQFSNTISVLLGNGNGTFQAQQTFATGNHPRFLAAVDVNGDGKPDLEVVNYSLYLFGSTVSMLLGNGNGTFQAQQTFSAGFYPEALAVGDVNGDGTPDLLIANGRNRNRVTELLGNGNGTFRGGSFYPGSLLYPRGLALGDVNGDGKPDLVVSGAYGRPAIVLLSTVTAGFQPAQTIAGTSDQRALALADVNGDGKPDLVISSAYGGGVSVLVGNGNGTFQAPLPGAGNGLSLELVDVNGDGKLDIVSTSGAGISVFLGNGNATFQAQQTFATGSSPTSVAVGDVNSDGKLDIAVVDAGGNTVSVLLNAANGNFIGQTYRIGNPNPPTHFVIVAPSSTPAGGTVSFTVTAEDQFNQLSFGYTGPVTFTSSDTNPATSLPGASLLTSGIGTFSATLTTAGLQTITATDAATSSITGASGTIAVAAGPATHFDIVNPATATAGIVFSFNVFAQDAFNNFAPSYAGAVTFSGSDTGPATVLPGLSQLTGGVGIFSATLTSPGSRILTVSDTVTASIRGISSAIVVSAAAATHFGFSDPTTTAGIAVLYTLTALDQFNNPAKGYNGTVDFSSTDTNATTLLPPNSTLTSGVGTFSATLTLAGNQSIIATDAATSTISGTNPITVSPAAVALFAFSAPQAVTASATPITVTVTALDQYNNTVPGVAPAQLVSGGAPAMVFSDPSQTSGVSNFGVIVTKVGRVMFTATDSTVPGLSDTDSITVGPAQGSQISDPVPITTAGNNLIVTVTIQDPFGNTATTYNGTVAITSTDTGLGTILPAHGTLASGVGVLSVTLSAAGNQTLTESSGTLLAVDVPVTVNPAAATHFLIVAPSGTTAGNALGYEVSALDQFNNSAPGYDGTVHITTSDPQAGLFPSTAALTNGTGIFAAILKTAGYQTLTATDVVTSSITGASSPIAVSVVPANHFVVTTALPSFPGIAAAYPTVPTAATSFVSTGVPVVFTVVAEDQFGNVNANYGGTVAFASSDTAAILPANSTLSRGVGTFSATLQTAGNNFITATDVTTASITGASSALVTRGLVVTSFAPTPSGFTITFDKQFNPSAVLMYTTGSTPDDIVLATTNSQVSVRGSVIFNATDTGFTFVKTDSISALGNFNPASGLLAAGNYTLTLRSLSGGNGFADSLSSPLDGTDTGAGANYRITFSVSAPPVAVGIPDFARGPSNTDAVFLASTLTNGSIFALSYTNPAANPTSGTATITFSTTSVTLQGNIQAALSGGGLAAQIGVNAGANNTPNSVVIVTNDTTTGANVLVTFQSALAQATNQLLSSSTTGVSIGLATINVANNLPGSGIPIGLSGGLGVTSGSFTLQYNPSLLTISGTTAKAVGASFTLISNTINNATSAIAVLSLSSPASLSSTAVPTIMGTLLATMPMSATSTYGAKQLLHFSSESLAGTAGPIVVTNADAVQVAAYLGDVTDLGGPLSLQDAGGVAAVAGTVANTSAQTIPGFAAFPNIDPAIIGDVALQGSVNSTDTGAMTQEVGGLARSTIPYAAIGLQVTPVGPGALLPANAGRRISTVTHGILSPAVLGRVFAEMAPPRGESWQAGIGEWQSDYGSANNTQQAQGELLASLAKPVNSAIPLGEGVAFDPVGALFADEADQATEMFPFTAGRVR